MRVLSRDDCQSSRNIQISDVKGKQQRYTNNKFGLIVNRAMDDSRSFLGHDDRYPENHDSPDHLRSLDTSSSTCHWHGPLSYIANHKQALFGPKYSKSQAERKVSRDLIFLE